MFGFNNINHQAKAMWLNSLGSASRTMLACTIVALITLYTPHTFNHHISLPAFSYVTVILIINNTTTLGDTLYSCWLALHASVQSLGPAMLCLWLIKPDKLSNTMTALATALGGFVVVLPGPNATHLVSKRIALGQIVLVYVIGFINGPSTDPILHPLHVAASTALGVIACVLALLLPYPKLASYQVKSKSQMYVENGTKRLKLYVKAFCGDEQIGSPMSCITQAKSLSIAGKKLLQNIKNAQESMRWEILPFKILRQYYVMPAAKLLELEMVLRGMELSTTSATQTSITTMLNAEIKQGLEEHLKMMDKQVKGWLLAPKDNKMVPESNNQEKQVVVVALKSLQTLQTDHITQLPSLFFLFCFNLLHRCSSSPCDGKHESSSSPKEDKKGESLTLLTKIRTNYGPTLGVTNQNLMSAFKCFLSLGLAVFLGLVYSKPDGYWAGLPVAISLASGREATFKVANLKAQGTVLGTVYAVLVCFTFPNSLPLRFISLVPWFVFTSFLRKSKMYGQAGGVSAIIGAVLILGRKGFGGPKEFAIARIVETFIGLFCSVMVDIVFQPTRASTLAKAQLAKCLSEFHLCVAGFNLDASKSSSGDHKRLKHCVDELSKYIEEAEAEPSFWFLGFNSGCYNKLKLSLTRAADYLTFGSLAIQLLESEVNNIRTESWKDTAENLVNDVKQFTETASCLLKCFEDVTKLKSVAELDKATAPPAADIEMGKSPKLKRLLLNSSKGGSKEEDEMGKIVMRYLEHMNDGLETIGGSGEDAAKGRMKVCLGAIGFCLDGLGKEVREMEKGVVEIIHWENGAAISHIDLYQISCKMMNMGSHQNSE